HRPARRRARGRAPQAREREGLPARHRVLLDPRGRVAGREGPAAGAPAAGHRYLRPLITTSTTPPTSRSAPSTGGSGIVFSFWASTFSGPMSTTFSLLVYVMP